MRWLRRRWWIYSGCGARTDNLNGASEEVVRRQIGHPKGPPVALDVFTFEEDLPGEPQRVCRSCKLHRLPSPPLRISRRTSLAQPRLSQRSHHLRGGTRDRRGKEARRAPDAALLFIWTSAEQGPRPMLDIDPPAILAAETPGSRRGVAPRHTRTTSAILVRDVGHDEQHAPSAPNTREKEEVARGGFARRA